MRKPVPDVFRAFGQAVLREVVAAGNRAATSAVKSVSADVKKAAKKAAKRMEEIEKRCGDFIGDDDDDLPDGRVKVEVVMEKKRKKS